MYYIKHSFPHIIVVNIFGSILHFVRYFLAITEKKKTNIEIIQIFKFLEDSKLILHKMAQTWAYGRMIKVKKNNLATFQRATSDKS